MIKEFHLFPLDRCCPSWSDSLNRNLIRLTVEGFCLGESDQPIAICPYCGESKQGRHFSPFARAH